MAMGYMDSVFVVVEYINHHVYMRYSTGRRMQYNYEWYEDLDTACTDVLPRLVECGFNTCGG